MRDITDKVQCLDCKYRRPWREHKEKKVKKGDKCLKARGVGISYLVDNSDKFEYNGINASDCEHKFTVERIRNSILWVRLYLKGLEKEPIVLEKNKHEIFIEARPSVQLIAGIADKYHAWQDRREVQKFLKQEVKRRTKVLTHIVKEL